MGLLMLCSNTLPEAILLLFTTSYIYVVLLAYYVYKLSLSLVLTSASDI